MRGVFSLAGLLALLLAGCAQKPTGVVMCEPPLEITDLAADLPEPQDGYLLVSDAHSQGLFPCAVAIAKLAIHDGDGDFALALTPVPPAEAALWAEALRGLEPLRKPLFLNHRTTKLEGQEFDGLCLAAAKLGARLLLVYAPNGTGPNTAQVLGVLYEVESRAALATLHASEHFVDEEGREHSPYRLVGDQRDVDARFQAQRAFEHQTVVLLRTLIQRDVSPPTSSPGPEWDVPFIERWWLWHRR